MHCIICSKKIVFSANVVTRRGKRARTVFDQAFLNQSPYCPDSPACKAAWRARQSHLFSVEKSDWQSASAPARTLNAALNSGMGKLLDDRDFTALKSVSKEFRSYAIPHQLSDSHRDTKHFDKKLPHGLDINADQMLDIAILAYHGALQVKSLDKPVILYRVNDKDALTAEEKLQTLSGRIRVRIPTGSADKEVWPLEKTVAWIQGALRAKASFLLLSDPRGNLLGGKDGRSDAVYVRELHQILGSHYMIEAASATELTNKMKAENIQPFILKPMPGTASTPMVPIPRMARHMRLTNTWDASVSSLTVSDPPNLLRDSLKQRFDARGTELGVTLY